MEMMDETSFGSGELSDVIKLHGRVNNTKEVITPNSIFNEVAGYKGGPPTDLNEAH